MHRFSIVLLYLQAELFASTLSVSDRRLCLSIRSRDSSRFLEMQSHRSWILAPFVASAPRLAHSTAAQTTPNPHWPTSALDFPAEESAKPCSIAWNSVSKVACPRSDRAVQMTKCSKCHPNLQLRHICVGGLKKHRALEADYQIKPANVSKSIDATRLRRKASPFWRGFWMVETDICVSNLSRNRQAGASNPRKRSSPGISREAEPRCATSKTAKGQNL